MTVLAGFIDFSLESSHRRYCDASIDALADYRTGAPHFLSSAGLCLAADQFSALGQDGHVSVAIDGRIDNLLDLNRSLNLALDAATGATLAAGWRRLGPELLQRLIGDFALVAVDSVARRWWLAADPSCQRPLFYCHADQRFAFASMPSGLEPAIGPLRIDFGQLTAALAFQPPGDRAVFENVYRVGAGELLAFGSAPPERSYWWQPGVGPSRDRQRSDYVEEYRSLLDQAVRCRLSTGPVAVQLSSGWDSSAVAATAANVRGGSNVIAYTSAPMKRLGGRMLRDRFADESALAARTAKMHRMQHEIVREGCPPFEFARRHAKLVQLPALNPFNGSWWEEIRVRAASAGGGVLLTGEMGNLSLNAGGLALLSNYLRAGDWSGWWREARLLVAAGRVRWRGVLFNSFGYRLPEPLVRQVERLAFGPSGTQLRYIRPQWQPDFPHYRSSGDHYRDRLRAIRERDAGPWRLSALAENGLVEADPTADRRLLEFSLALPLEQLLHNGRMRPLARAALADRVPAEVLDHPARGLQSADWYLRVDKQQAADALRQVQQAPLACEFLDVQALSAAIERWPTRHWNNPQVYGRYRVQVVAALATGLFIKEWSN